MANAEQVDLILSGVDAWNKWRRANPSEPVDLKEADLLGANLSGALLHEADLRDAGLHKANLIGANLEEAHLERAFLREAILIEANFSHARLKKACLDETNLYQANLRNANLGKASLIKAELTYADFTKANLTEAHIYKSTLEDTIFQGATLIKARFTSSNLFRTDFRGANMTDARLDYTQLVGTDFRGTIMQGCSVYGISAWDVKLDASTQQKDLIITPSGETIVTADNLKVAQFIYLLLNNSEIREAIETIGRKVVLILGRFSEERKAVLDALRAELRNHNYMPVLFDFTGPTNRNIIETVGALAHLARFVIADVTEPKMILEELEDILPVLPSLPVKPILLNGSEVHSALLDFSNKHPSFLSLYYYNDSASLLAALPDEIIAPAEKRAFETEGDLQHEKTIAAKSSMLT